MNKKYTYSLNYDNISNEELSKQHENTRKMYLNFMNNMLLEKYTFPDHPSSDGYYHIHVKDETKKGGRKQIKAKTLETLRDKVLQFEKNSNRTNILTFKELFEIRWDNKLKYTKNNDKSISVRNTYGKDKQSYNRFIRDTFFEKLLLPEITKETIEELLLINCNRYDLKIKAFSNLRSLINVTLDYATKNNLISKNPMELVDSSKFKNMIEDSVPISERAYSDKEIVSIINALHEIQKKQPTYMAPYALELQIYMGCRRGEIPPLKWSDIYDNKTIFIYQEQLTVPKAGTGKKEYDIIVNHTKNYTNRHFPITSEISDLLTRLEKVHRDYNIKSDFLFPAPTVQGCIRNSRLYYAYRKACKECNIKTIPGIIKGTHSFRRNAITSVYNQTGNLIGTSKLFGNSPEAIMKHYFTDMPMEDAIKALENRSYTHNKK